MPPVVTRLESGGRVREVYSAEDKIWACYARSGGQCFKPAGVPCPCDGWEPFMLSWRGIVNAIEGQLGDDVEDRPEWLKPRPPAERCIADLLDVCIFVAETEGQISDREHTRLIEWLARWRTSNTSIRSPPIVSSNEQMEDGWSPFAGRDE
jgi:hypothetical protein